MLIKKLTTAVLTSAIASCNLIAVAQNVRAQTPETQTAPEGSVGFKIVDRYLPSVNQVEITEITYTGQCPGTKIESQEVVFFSKNTPTASDRRVLISNVSGGEGEDVNLDLQPFTDREYEEDNNSEDIKLTLGNKHQDNRFVVFEGQNRIKYEIVDITESNDQEYETIIEDGYFDVDVKRLRTSQERRGRVVSDKIGDSVVFRTQC